jgi:triphosphatase
MPSKSLETELKLLLDQKDLAALDGCPFVSAHRRGQPTTRRLDATYYDTPDHALRRADLALRVRRSGKRFVQTLKRAASDGHPLQRGEWEVSVASLVPEPAALADTLPDDLRVMLEAAPLGPVFKTGFRRRQCLIDVADATIEIAVDEGSIEANGRTVPISEIELELKSGPVAALYETALQLLDHHQFTLGVESKSTRGYALALDLSPGAVKAPAMVVGPEVPLGDAFEQILRASQAQVLTNQAAAADGRDSEGVHQMRVGLRRLRSALSLLRAVAPSPTLESLREDAKWVASALSDARGWDVFLAEILPEAAAGCGGIRSFDSLRTAANILRERAYAIVRQEIAAPRYVRFHLTLGVFIERKGWHGSDGRLTALADDTAAYAARTLADRHRKVLKRGRHFRHLTPESRHELRIAAKKLRYTADFFLTALDHRRVAKRYLKRLGALQDQLGHYNDMAMTGGLIERLLQAELAGEARLAAGGVLGWQARGLVEAESVMLAAWHAFREVEPPWPRHPSGGVRTHEGSA